MSLSPIELELLTHRYLYYVLCSPILSDYEYDCLEAKAEAKSPVGSPIFTVGSDLASSYPLEVQANALKLLGAKS